MRRKRPKQDPEFPNMSDHDLLLWTASALESLTRKVDNHLKHHQTLFGIVVSALLITLGAFLIIWFTT